METEKVLSVLKYLKIDYKEFDDFYRMKTVCHGGDSDKLYLYKNSNMFVCYTHCGNMTVFDLISKVKHVSINKAYYIFNLVNDKNSKIEGFSFESEINPGLKFEKRSINREKVNYLDDSILKYYYNFASSRWIDEGISIETQNKFNIRFSIIDNAIIIPHYLYNGKLIGVRQRNLNQIEVDEGKKYVPVYYNNRSLKYPIRENLYGLYENKDNIVKSRKIILFEAEKSVMMLDTFYHGHGMAVALSGSSLSDRQAQLISKMPVDEVIIGLDKEYSDDLNSQLIRKEIIEKKFNKLNSRFSVSIIWDNQNLLDQKDSPTDKGKQVFEKLMQNRLFV